MTGIRTLIPILAASALGLLASPAAGAQEVAKLDFADSVTITSVDWETGRILASDLEGTAVDVLMDDETRLMVGAQEVSPFKLAAGDRVVIEARREMEGERSGEALVADRILIVVDPSLNADPERSTLGRVVRADAVEGTLQVEAGEPEGPLHFRIPDDGVTIEGVPSSLNDVEMGDRVAVRHEERSGTGASPIQADDVRVERASMRDTRAQDGPGEPVLRDVDAEDG